MECQVGQVLLPWFGFKMSQANAFPICPSEALEQEAKDAKAWQFGIGAFFCQWA